MNRIIKSKLEKEILEALKMAYICGHIKWCQSYQGKSCDCHFDLVYSALKKIYAYKEPILQIKKPLTN